MTIEEFKNLSKDNKLVNKICVFTGTHPFDCWLSTGEFISSGTLGIIYGYNENPQNYAEAFRIIESNDWNSIKEQSSIDDDDILAIENFDVTVDWFDTHEDLKEYLSDPDTEYFGGETWMVNHSQITLLSSITNPEVLENLYITEDEAKYLLSHQKEGKSE